jgi:hypothetical protein
MQNQYDTIKGENINWGICPYMHDTTPQEMRARPLDACDSFALK